MHDVVPRPSRLPRGFLNCGLVTSGSISASGTGYLVEQVVLLESIESQFPRLLDYPAIQISRHDVTRKDVESGS